jgi:isoleucyl-tRNA synthetase
MMGLRWPLASLTIKTKKENFNTIKEFSNIIKLQVNVKKINLEEAKKSNEESVSIDTSISPELEAEGYAREISRRVQALRKKAGLKKEEKISLLLQMDRELQKLLQNQIVFIKKRVNAFKLDFKNIEEKTEKFDSLGEEIIKNKKIKIGFNIK